MIGQDLIPIARTWLEVPFRHQGRSRLAVDCAGLVEVVAQQAGLTTVDYRAPRNYHRRGQAQLKQILEKHCERIDEPEIGCVVLIRFPGEEFASHLAFYAGETIIHCYEKIGRVVEHGYRGPWREWTEGFYRLRGVECCKECEEEGKGPAQVKAAAGVVTLKIQTKVGGCEPCRTQAKV